MRLNEASSFIHHHPSSYLRFVCVCVCVTCHFASLRSFAHFNPIHYVHRHPLPVPPVQTTPRRPQRPLDRLCIGMQPEWNHSSSDGQQSRVVVHVSSGRKRVSAVRMPTTLTELYPTICPRVVCKSLLTNTCLRKPHTCFTKHSHEKHITLH